MKIKYLHIAMVALLMTGCSEAEIDNGQQQKGIMPVLFSAGNMDATVTRGATASYMPQGSRFVCSMFFHAGAYDDNKSKYYPEGGTPTSDVNMTTAWLKIDNATGNAVYWNKSFLPSETTDDYGFDKAANCFYWQNRMNHIFLALTDNNNLDGDTGDGTLKIYPDVTDKYKDKYMLAYDLTKGASMSQQPDPILAVETISPLGSTPESNRVKLFFKHQFSQVQVNLKSSQDSSAVVDESLIESVELLGVAETGYVAYCINPDGTVTAATSAPINIDDPKYARTKKDNPYGSSFKMFDRSEVPTGYLKSFECIAFGTLQGIRITWKESNDENAVKHITTFSGVKDKALVSGMKYIYNMELRRSVIAKVTAEVTAWTMDQTEYNADGTIEIQKQ
jgi:hypothetical protein